MSKQKVIAFDLDDVICYRPDGYEHLGVDKYNYCMPYQDAVDLVNSLYEENYIKIYTARGMSQFKGDVDLIHEFLYNATIDQLNFWGVKFNELIMGKTHYDVLIDDKALNSHKINKSTINQFLKEGMNGQS